MTGSRQLTSRPKRTLGALGLGLCAVAVAVGSGANFSAQTANPSNTFSAGSLSMDNSKDGAAIFSAENMKPGGGFQTGVVDIENTGSIEGNFTLTRDQLTSTDDAGDNPVPFASKVFTWVADCGGSTPGGELPPCGDADDDTVYNGWLANQNAALDLGTFKPGEKHRYWFGAELDESAGGEYSGDGASARYVFDAVQKP